MENTNFLQKMFFAFLAMGLLSVTAFAGTTPDVVDDYIDVFVDLSKGKAGVIFIVIVLAMSGFLSWKNGNLSPMLWGLAAAVLIGGAPYIADDIITFGSTTF